MDLFVALAISFQSLTNFTKNAGIGAMGVFNAPLEYYTYSEFFAGYQIKYCGTTGISIYLAKLLHYLFYIEQEALVLFLLLYLSCKTILLK